ncbi:MAG: hypothetical protein ACO2O6_09995 [Candidatus Hydrothermia bacterium]|jgi:hypothetical protein
MRIRKLLICAEPKNEIEKELKKIYLKRIKEMFKKTISLESSFNIFDEIFHGLSQVSKLDENLHSFYEALLTITSYYQHSQAGRGSLVAKLLENLGTAEKTGFELTLINLPKWLEQNIGLEENELTKQKFDIVSKNGNNLVFCELKMKVYSGCTAGRIELMGKFNKFTKLLIGDQTFRNCLKNSGIENVFLICGVLFDIQGDPATVEKDEKWGICYNGLTKGKEDIIKTLKEKNVEYKLDEKRLSEEAFRIEFMVDDIKVNILAVYGDEVIKSLFVGKQKYTIEHFKNQLEGILYDDLWLGQIITISERTVLELNFKKNKRLNNYVISILKSREILEEIKKFAEIKKFQQNKIIEKLEEITAMAIKIIHQNDENLKSISPTFAEMIMSLYDKNYKREDYVADVIQFLSCNDIINDLLMILLNF